MENHHNELILLPSLAAYQDEDGKLFVTRKYLDGAEMYQRYWPGKVTTLFKRIAQPTTDLDQVELKTQGADGSHTSELRPADEASLARRVSGAMVVLSWLSPLEWPVFKVCRRLGVPLVMVSEYSPRTEFQIIDADDLGPIKTLYRKGWTVRAEAIRLSMLPRLAGIQCSGMPTFLRYRWWNPNPMVFFDNRVLVKDILSEADLRPRLEMLQASSAPLRLVFGGRFIAMKGIMELPKVASALVKRGVPFTMDIVGDGPLKPDLLAAIERQSLARHVRVLPPLDFKTGWIPKLKKEADIFVCCHPQGDPSSTYPEVMSCGLPVAGYANEALEGVLARSGGGWHVPLMQPEALADLIARLHGDRGEIAAAAHKARKFAEKHAFEHTFRRRTEHLVEASRLPPGSGVSS